MKIPSASVEITIGIQRRHEEENEGETTTVKTINPKIQSVQTQYASCQNQAQEETEASEAML